MRLARRLLRPAILACGTSFGATSLRAQTIRGRVLLGDSITPGAGIVITAIGPGDLTAGRALSTSIGAYTLSLKAAGTYELRAIRIGFRPAVVRDIAVSAGETVVRNITMSALPVSIATMEIRGDGDCSLKGRDGQTLLQLWEQARGALAATHLWEQSGALDVRLVRVEGHVDAPASFTDSLFATVDTLHARELVVDRAFAATLPETLTTRGFVRPRADGRLVYDVPNAEVLLSDAFVDGHCFGVQSAREHPDWIGLRFTPRRRVDGLVDVTGVLWLDRATAELRRLEFQYANLPSAEYEVCDRNPFVVMTPERLKEMPPLQQPNARCEHAKNDRSNKLGLGGYANFVRVESGEWLVSEWMVRSPPDEGRIRPMPWRLRIVKGNSERCYVGPDCHTLLIMRPRLVTSMGTIVDVMRGGVRVYEDRSGNALIDSMAAKRAGSHPAAFFGTVADADGRFLVYAVLQIEDPSLAVHTDGAGAFSFRALPPDSISISVRCGGYRPIRFRLPLLPDSTRRATLSMVPDTSALPSSNCAVAK